MENNLPVGWESAKLSHIVEYKKGKKPKRLESEPFQDSLTYLDIRAIEKNVSEIFADPGSSTISDTNELVIVWDGARAGWVGLSRVGAVGSTLMALRPKIDKLFLYRFLQSQFDYLHSNHRGTGIPHVDPDILWNIDVTIPPLNEQQRIVAKLNSLFEKIETNKKRLEKIPQILKRFRQSVLAAAIQGRLTTQWRFESGCTEDWENTTLFDVIEGKAKNGYSAKPVNYETPFRVLTLTATTSGIFKPEHIKYFDEKIDPNSEFWIQPNDILIQRGNTLEYVGVSAVYEGETNKLIYPDLMIRVRASEKILTKYLYYVLSAEKSRNYLRERATGTAGNMPKINQPTLNSLPIELPSKREQEEIVKRVEKLFSFADKVEARYLKAKAQLDKLPQSILAKAFRGELVPQDSEDEPANLLLERILTAKRIKK